MYLIELKPIGEKQEPKSLHSDVKDNDVFKICILVSGT